MQGKGFEPKITGIIEKINNNSNFKIYLFHWYSYLQCRYFRTAECKDRMDNNYQD